MLLVSPYYFKHFSLFFFLCLQAYLVTGSKRWLGVATQMPFLNQKSRFASRTSHRKFAFKFSLRAWPLSVTSSSHLRLYLEMATDLKGGNLFLVLPFARPFELLRCVESQNVNQSLIIKIDFKILFFHSGIFFHCLNHTLVLYKRNFGLYTIGKNSFYWLELRVRRCANGLKLYIFCRGNILQMLKSAFSWQTSKNHTETESKICNKRFPQSLTFGTDIN